MATADGRDSFVVVDTVQFSKCVCRIMTERECVAAASWLMVDLSRCKKTFASRNP